MVDRSGMLSERLDKRLRDVVDWSDLVVPVVFERFQLTNDVNVELEEDICHREEMLDSI
jgi:hypothetical protein